MENKISHDHKKNVLRFALFIGELMLINGAESYRVEDTILRICKSRNYNHINVFISPTAIIISDYRSIDLNKISLLNNLSRKYVSTPQLNINEAMIELKKINQIKSYSPFAINLCTGFSSAFFAILLEGDNLPTFISTFITSILAVKIYNKMIEVSTIPAFSSFVASSFIGFIGVILTHFNIISAPTMLVVGSIMPLLPGVSFIKGIRDLIAGDLMSGVARAFDAGVTAVSIACGVGIILDVWFRLGGVL